MLTRNSWITLWEGWDLVNGGGGGGSRSVFFKVIVRCW